MRFDTWIIDLGTRRNPPLIYVVLGMHKSGTTLVSQCLEASGIDMGDFDRELDYGSGNTFERLETQEFNRDLLHGHLIPPLDYLLRRSRVPVRDALGYRRNNDSTALIRYRALARRKLRAPERQRMRSLIQSCSSRASDWGFKDPRTCLTYPLWREELPEHRLVVVFRGLPQLLQRYRVSRRTPMRYFRVVHAWTLHNWMILKHLRDSPAPSIVIRYERLMYGDETLDKLSSFVGKPLTDARKPALYRNKTQPDDHLSGVPRGVSRLLPADPQDVFSQLLEHAI